MPQNNIITVEYFKRYRQELGFRNQADAKNFFGAKDIIPTIDLSYLRLLNQRLYEIVERINSVAANEIKLADLGVFRTKHIDHAFEIIRTNNILPRLNNQGRRPEDVYFNWMRGYVVSNFFLKALGLVFEVDVASISSIGEDDLRNAETFKRAPTADLELTLPTGERLRIEMQAGFTGTNDIKQHKVLEAKRVFRDGGIHSLAIHFDLYNGQVAFIKLDMIEDGDVNWVTRQQMEGQTVFNIEQNYFVWKIKEPPVTYREIDFD